MTDLPTYAWCFSHGTLHYFRAGQEPWCTTTWMPIDGSTEDEALAAKQQQYGDAQFLHDLPAEQQITLILGAERDTDE